jgi:hypothetical protein
MRTIRDDIVQRLKWSTFVACFAIMVIAITAFMQKLAGARLVSALAFVVLAGVVLYQTYRIRCPKCNGNLGKSLAPALRNKSSANKVLCCPFCRISLNTECAPVAKPAEK